MQNPAQLQQFQFFVDVEPHIGFPGQMAMLMRTTPQLYVGWWSQKVKSQILKPKYRKQLKNMTLAQKDAQRHCDENPYQMTSGSLTSGLFMQKQLAFLMFFKVLS